MKKSDVVVFLLGMNFGVGAGTILSAIAVGGFADELWRRNAVENNAAEWRVDPKTGETTFTWLTKPDAEE